MQNNRIAKTKEYVKDHAPELVTAAASVSLVIIALQYIKSTNNNIRRAQAAIPEMIKENRPFHYYPRVGLYWDNPE